MDLKDVQQQIRKVIRTYRKLPYQVAQEVEQICLFKIYKLGTQGITYEKAYVKPPQS